MKNERISSAFIAGTSQKRLRSQLFECSGFLNDDDFKEFLGSLRFDLGKGNLEKLRREIQNEWLGLKLGLNPIEDYNLLMDHVE